MAKGGRNRRHVGAWWRVPAFSMAIMAAVGTAGASPRPCAELEARLASLPADSGTPSTSIAKYDAALARQHEQLLKTRDRARQAGCGGAMAGDALAACAALNGTIAKMQDNFAKLQNERRALGLPADAVRERAQLLAAIDFNGCRAEPLPEPETFASMPEATVDHDTETSAIASQTSAVPAEAAPQQSYEAIIRRGEPAAPAKSAAIEEAIPHLARERALPDRPVRVVGPTFFPDPEGAIDLRTPARTHAP